MSPPLPDVSGLELSELEALLEGLGARRFHARQIYRWVFRRATLEFERMTDLPGALRARLPGVLTVTGPVVRRTQHSVDGTVKFLLELRDARQIEAVYIPDSPRHTFCVSTQVGCAMGCGFCLTGKMGLVRNLAAGEIVGQVRALATELDLLTSRFNVVLMGMGEPLHNYDETMKALRILACEHGLAVSPRRVTLSTVGLVPGLERLAKEPVVPNLAISLHGTTEAQRSRLVPVNRKYGLDQVLDACRRFPLKQRSRLTFEYVLIAGVNDSQADAERLARLLRDLRAKVNVIPLNEAAGIPFRRPDDRTVDRFAGILARHRLTVSVRKSRGRDIRAACGQLIVEGGRPSPAQQLAARLTESPGRH